MTFYCDKEVAAQLEAQYPRLASLFGGHFNMDAYVSSSPNDLDRVLTDEEIFADIRSTRDELERAQLANDLTQLLLRDDAAVVSLWNAKAFSHNYNLEDADGAREFLSKLKRHLAG